MAVKLYGAAHSTCTRRVMVVLEEKKVPYQLIPINLGKREHETVDFKATKQPFGKVPVLDDDGFQIYESRAICRYIAKKWAGQGTKLMPDDSDMKGYGMFEQVNSNSSCYGFQSRPDKRFEACAIEQSYFDGPAAAIAFEKVFKP
jgi:glutathione S-transferase